MAKATISFHPKGHKWFLAPDFSAFALSDDDTISYAMELVLRAKRKSVMPAEKTQLVNDIVRITKSDKVGTLRAMDDEGWKKLDIPLLARVYLKHLIMQSVSLTRQQLLECDFNSGLPLDLAAMQTKITQILALGFARDEALDALVVTGNQQIEMAAQYLLTDSQTRAMERERAKKRFNKSVPPNRHHTIIEQLTSDKVELAKWVKVSDSDLKKEVNIVMKQLQSSRDITADLVKKRDYVAKENAILLYTEYLRGIISDPRINATEVQRIDAYREQRNISEDDHKKALETLKLDEERFDKMKTFEETQQSDECLVCYEPPRDHMIIPCHHVCLCGDCAAEYKEQEDGKCPLCDSGIEDIRQIYYF